MKRREFITLIGGAAVAWPLAARAQQSDKVRRIGVLMGWPESDPEARSERAAFIQELQKLGWPDGRNLRTDTRWANPSDPESMHRFAKERGTRSNSTPAVCTSVGVKRLPPRCIRCRATRSALHHRTCSP